MEDRWSLIRLLGIRDPQTPVPQWHVSPQVDTMAYGFSWVWVLVPMMFYGENRLDFMAWFLLIMAVTDVHRHFNFPYVYLDKDIRQRHPLRFWLLPAVLLVMWAASPWLARYRPDWALPQVAGIVAWVVCLAQALGRDRPELRPVHDERISNTRWFIPCLTIVASVAAHLGGWLPEMGWIWMSAALCWSLLFGLSDEASENATILSRIRSFRAVYGGSVAIAALMLAVALVHTERNPILVPSKIVLASVAVFAGLWNFWHVYMQKYGIMRMYNAKARTPDGPEVPGWVDRLLIFAWMPLYFSWLAPNHKKLIMSGFARAKFALPTVLEFLTTYQTWLVGLSLAFLGFSVAAFVYHERRVFGFRNRPRLTMAAGTFLLGVSFLVINPMKSYLAFSFSHAIEYMVFVWAFQRRRYSTPLPHRPHMARALARPLLFYGVFILGLAATFLYLKYWGRHLFPELSRPEAWGYRTSIWMSYWGVYQSMLHFYFDGFLWKIRASSLRAQL